MKKTSVRGDFYYKKAGFTKPVVIHLSADVHKKLSAIAAKEERSLQVTVRRILDAYLQPDKKA